jgi:hypothetical protein
MTRTCKPETKIKKKHDFAVRSEVAYIASTATMNEIEKRPQMFLPLNARRDYAL